MDDAALAEFKARIRIDDKRTQSWASFLACEPEMSNEEETETTTDSLSPTCHRQSVALRKVIERSTVSNKNILKMVDNF